jgi:peptidoglycan/xylan/chitin deacetylase (PgdA/CDA1 family)
MLLIFLILLFQNFRLRRAIVSLWNAPLPAATVLPKSANRSAPESVSVQVQMPVRGAMIFSNRIQVQGQAKDGLILVLENAKGPLAVTLPKHGEFRFDPVRISRKDERLRVKAITPNGDVLKLEELTLNFAPPSVRFLATPLRRGVPEVRKMALTFDGGASNNVAGEILDILKAKGVHCTLFLTGQFLQHYPEMVRRIVQEGHEVGNHTFDHPHLTTYEENRRHLTRPEVTREFFQTQLLKTAELFQKITGHKMAPYWRPPYGESNRQIRQWAAEIGFREVDWTLGSDRHKNMDTRDWVARPEDPGYQTSEEIEKKILAFAREKGAGANGAIVLMHLGSNRQNDFPHKKLPEIIDSLRAAGYQLVPISELEH